VISNYTDEILLSTYRELHFPGVVNDQNGFRVIAEAARLLLDSNDAAAPFYDDLATIVLSCTPAKTMLDVGCAMGRLFTEIENRGWVGSYLGLDLSEEMIQEANRVWVNRLEPAQDADWFAERRLPRPQIRRPNNGQAVPSFVRADACEMPLEDNTFDLVVLANVVDRVPRPWSVLAECWRVLQPGGYLVLTDPFDWDTQPFSERFYSFDDLASNWPDAIACLVEPTRSMFCVRRRDGDRLAVYENHNAVLRKRPQ
jgi:SAM-dependent methyltransferase